jgi:hypothetical protein
MSTVQYLGLCVVIVLSQNASHYGRNALGLFLLAAQAGVWIYEIGGAA